jgi:hypothetical protein
MKFRARMGSLTRLFMMTAALFTILGCQAKGIGDPCVPEAIPANGFDVREIYVETSSVQCRTRTCIVFKLDGNPADDCDPNTENCANPQEPVTSTTSAERVFCSCRCSAAGGDVNTPLCECGDGFHCVDVLTAGGEGIRGGYCVPNVLCTSDDDCSTTCNFETGTCNL